MKSNLFNRIVSGEYDEIPDHYSEDIKDLISIMLNVRPENRWAAPKILKKIIVIQ